MGHCLFLLPNKFLFGQSCATQRQSLEAKSVPLPTPARTRRVYTLQVLFGQFDVHIIRLLHNSTFFQNSFGFVCVLTGFIIPLSLDSTFSSAKRVCRIIRNRPVPGQDWVESESTRPAMLARKMHATHIFSTTLLSEEQNTSTAYAQVHIVNNRCLTEPDSIV